MFDYKLNLNYMLTPHQKQEAQRKLKIMNEQLAVEEQLKNNIKNTAKIIQQSLTSISNDPKKYLETIKNISNNIAPNTIYALDTALATLQQLCQKMKNEKEKVSRDCLSLIQQKQRFQTGIKQIKGTILNIQKTVKESVEQQVKKRRKIEEDLQKSLDDIRSKIVQFEKESEGFDKQNVELRQKIEGLKAKLTAIEQNYKVRSEEKEGEVSKQKQELTQKLKALQIEVEKATELNKVYSALEKKNFDNKLSVYLKTKKFPEFGSSFESSAKTLDSCKQQLLKGVSRLNIAAQTIDRCEKQSTQNNNQLLLEMKKQKQKQARLLQLKKQKQVARGRIIELQGRLKQKKKESG